MKILPFARYAQRHVPDADLEAYVDDTLAPEQVERLEAHVADCAGCAERLADAARFENLLHAAAEGLAVAPAVDARPSLGTRLRRHLGVASGAWAAAAAFAVMVWGSGPSSSHDDAPGTAPVRVAQSEWVRDPWAAGCEPGEPSCGDDLLASIDPLESVDPLSSWPDDPLAIAGWEAPWSEGEPCGSGEDGGPLVCPRRVFISG